MEESWPEIASNETFQQRINDAKVLVVGSGGIGCELLKTLALSGFLKLDVIDMDTIETSNLNRQFLFRKRHVGKSKSEVAAESIRAFCPKAEITAHKANIKNPEFGIEFFKGFDIIMNGLDNVEARRHVNRLALAANIPLIESGTMGYQGQVTVHIKDKTHCYECDEKPVQKSYPICTIRNTPDKPIHCIVWAKDLLFQRLFGRQDQVTDLDEPSTTGGNGETEDVDQDKSFFVRNEGEAAGDYALRVFERVFNTDIKNVCKIEKLWDSRSRPKALDLPKSVNGTNGCSTANGGEGKVTNESQQKTQSPANLLGFGNDHEVWTLQQNMQVFLKCIETFLSQRSGEIGFAEFDKDDDLAVEFVTSASNLRSICYGIPCQTLFDAKGMAGNIIHAIATTNAIVSGLMVVEGMKVLSGKFDSLRETFLGESVGTKHGSGARGRELIIKAGTAAKPEKKCMVCGTSKLSLKIDTQKTNFGDFISQVIKKRLSVNVPAVMCGDIWYEEGDDLDEEETQENAAMLPHALEKLPGGGIKDGSIVAIKDQSQNFEVEIIVSHKGDIDEDDHPSGFILDGNVPSASADPEKDPAADEPGPSAFTMSDDDIFYMSDDEQEADGLKRKRDSDDEVELVDFFMEEGGHSQPDAPSGNKKRKV
ncbi:hypothetical protein BSKO_10344 [Bryopsis sp. KO-2023]|nr:hypothetical protein BSKO_10344 [Bryopsis sp. KO-2023]